MSPGTGKALGAVTGPPAAGDAGRVREHRWSRGSITVRLGAVAALLMAACATWLAGAPPTLLLILGVVALGGLAALRPESPAGAVVLLFVLWWWTVADVEVWHAAALVALPCLVTAHVLLTIAALTPPFMPLDRDVARLWAGRAAVLSAAGAAVLAVSWLSSRGGTGWAVVAVALFAVVVTALALALLYPRSDPPT